MPYAFADFINPAGVEFAARYRAEFKPSSWRPAPELIVAVWAVCAATDDAAKRLATSAMMSFKLLQRGRLIPVPPIERAIAFLDQERAASANVASGFSRTSRRRIVGSPETVRSGIEAVAEEYGADEVMVVTITFDHADRRRSYELIAEAFGLSAA